MTIQETLKNIIDEALLSLGVPEGMANVVIDRPTEESHGDYSTNVAMMLFKSLGASSKNPFELAQRIVNSLKIILEKEKNVVIQKVEAVPPGFINFYLAPEFFIEAIKEVLKETAWYGKNKKLWNKKIIIEHTNFNPYKPIHIGHLVNNAVGESLSRILEFQDVKLTRASYGGDVGMHVARAMWGMQQLRHEFPRAQDPRSLIEFIGKAYAFGSEAFETNEKIKLEIQELNKKIYTKSDPEVNEMYEWGRTISLDYFKTVYALLGSRFDFQFWESEVAEEGRMIVSENIARGIFEKSDGAIIFPGEKYGLHNRVFINSQGLPTYEAKEIGLTKKKFELHDFDTSIVITGNEQDDYFKVIIEALKHVYPEIGNRTKHISHGVLRLSTGKMSSRKGNVITMESLLEELEGMVQVKMKDRDYSVNEKKEISEKVALAAVRYTILRQSIGRDIIFDEEKSLSFEGDSGPYLQYTYVRAKSILAKAKEEGIEANITSESIPEEVTILERMIHTFPEIVERAAREYTPNYIATYLIELAAAFNSYYAKHKIISKKDHASPYRLALTEATSWVLKNGMYLLGIEAPERM